MPRYYLRVALWQIPTMVVNPRLPDAEREASLVALNALNNLAHVERMRLLEEQVTAAAHYFATQVPPAGHTAIDLFVAPEYLFTRGNTEHFIDEASKDRLCTLLEQLSTRFPSMVIVPGTIAWKKPAIRSNVVAQFFLRDRGARAQRRRDRVGAMIGNNSQTRFTEARQSREQYYLAENSAYVYSGGRRRLKYHKRNDGGEVNAADGERVFWVPGDREATFRHQGLQFGLQICAEHGSRPAAPVDVQIVIASSHPLRIANGNTRPNGYLVYCDAVLAPEVRRSVDGAFQLIDASGSATGSPLTPAQIATRAARSLELQPARRRAGETDDEATARRTEELTTQLGGRVRYYVLPYVT